MSRVKKSRLLIQQLISSQDPSFTWITQSHACYIDLLPSSGTEYTELSCHLWKSEARVKTGCSWDSCSADAKPEVGELSLNCRCRAFDGMIAESQVFIEPSSDGTRIDNEANKLFLSWCAHVDLPCEPPITSLADHRKRCLALHAKKTVK